MQNYLRTKWITCVCVCTYNTNYEYTKINTEPAANVVALWRETEAPDFSWVEELLQY